MDSLTANPTPYNHCLPSVSSCGEQTIRYPAAGNSPPRFLQADEVTAELPNLRQHALGMSVPVLPIYKQGVHIAGRYRHKCLFLSPSGLACCNHCQPSRVQNQTSFVFVFFHFMAISALRYLARCMP